MPAANVHTDVEILTQVVLPIPGFWWDTEAKVWEARLRGDLKFGKIR
jgi:hypothetical protein